jgi:hypothetical protein
MNDQTTHDPDRQDPAAGDPVPGPAQPGPDPAGQAQTGQERGTWGRLHTDAVTVLTAAVRLRRDGGEPDDFADFLAHVLAAVAANVGSVERVTAGRPGSWEADLVHRLVFGTVGDDDRWLYGHRTEPVVVPLNVDQVRLQAWWDGLPGAAEDPDEVADRLVDALAPPDTADDQAWDTYAAFEDAQYDTVRARYAAAYQGYADRFTAAVHAAAIQLGLTVPVRVEACADLDAAAAQGRPVNPDPDGWGLDDHLAARLWQTARTQTGHPAIDNTPATTANTDPDPTDAAGSAGATGEDHP